MPGSGKALRWALQPGAEGGGTSRARLAWRALRAHVVARQGLAPLDDRGVRAALARHRARPAGRIPARHPARRCAAAPGSASAWSSSSSTPTGSRPLPAARPSSRLVSGAPLVLAELAPPRGYDFMRLQLEQAPPQSPEGELLLTLSLQRSADVQHKPQPMEAGVLCFSRFRVDGVGCLVIGGVRGQRHPVQRIERHGNRPGPAGLEAGRAAGERRAGAGPASGGCA